MPFDAEKFPKCSTVHDVSISALCVQTKSIDSHDSFDKILILVSILYQKLVCMYVCRENSSIMQITNRKANHRSYVAMILIL